MQETADRSINFVSGRRRVVHDGNGGSVRKKWGCRRPLGEGGPGAPAAARGLGRMMSACSAPVAAFIACVRGGGGRGRDAMMEASRNAHKWSMKPYAEN